VGSPLKLIRQYKKNVGRTLIVKTVKENLEAELVEANDDFVILAWGERAQKIGKEDCSKKLLTTLWRYQRVVTVTFN
jgi:ribosome maturation factor RimP